MMIDMHLGWLVFFILIAIFATFLYGLFIELRERK